jgi:drug/metabolite transporter (DMT)-like permease
MQARWPCVDRRVFTSQAIALETSPAGVQAFLLALSVLVCPMLEQLVEHKEQPQRVWYAAVLAAVGVAALELDGLMHGSLSQGDLIGLLQPLFFGAGFFECERAMRRHQDGDKDIATPIALTAWQLAAVLALTGAWTMAAGGGAGLDHVVEQARALFDDPVGHAAVLGTILWTGVGTTAGCSLVEAAALGELSSSDATVVFATEPLWGAAFAAFLLGERMGPQCQVGGLLMCLACVVSATEGSPAEVFAAARATASTARGAAKDAFNALAESLGLAMGYSPRQSRAFARASLRMRAGANTGAARRNKRS